MSGEIRLPQARAVERANSHTFMRSCCDGCVWSAEVGKIAFQQQPVVSDKRSLVKRGVWRYDEIVSAPLALIRSAKSPIAAIDARTEVFCGKASDVDAEEILESLNSRAGGRRESCANE